MTEMKRRDFLRAGAGMGLGAIAENSLRPRLALAEAEKPTATGTNIRRTTELINGEIAQTVNMAKGDVLFLRAAKIKFGDKLYGANGSERGMVILALWAREDAINEAKITASVKIYEDTCHIAEADPTKQVEAFEKALLQQIEKTRRPGVDLSMGANDITIVPLPDGKIPTDPRQLWAL